jgi:hypothetical protein
MLWSAISGSPGVVATPRADATDSASSIAFRISSTSSGSCLTFPAEHRQYALTPPKPAMISSFCHKADWTSWAATAGTAVPANARASASAAGRSSALKAPTVTSAIAPRWTTTPGSSIQASIRETPPSTIASGNRSTRNRSLSTPFWREQIEVPGRTAAATASAADSLS